MDFHHSLVRLCLVPAMSLSLLTSCAKTQSTVGKDAAKPTEQPQLATDNTSRVREIQAKVGALDQIADESGVGGASSASDSAHRQVMEQFFGGLTQVLPLIKGEFESGEFRQSMRILESARQQLAGSPGLAAEPTVGQGLRASLRVLTALNSTVFGNEDEITKSLDGLRKKVEELDTTHGPLNRLIAAQSMRSTVQVLQQMSNVLAERAGIDVTPAPAPAKAAARAE